MRKFKLFLVTLFTTLLVFSMHGQSFAERAVLDFDGLSDGTPADNINADGVSFTASVANGWLIDDIGANRTTLSTGKRLIGSSGLLTLDFDLPADLIRFVFMYSNQNNPMVVNLYKDGALLETRTLVGAILTSGGFYEGTAQIEGDFDRMVIAAVQGAIDNLYFEDAPAVGYLQAGTLRMFNPVQPRGTANGLPVMLSATTPLILPADQDANGYDDFVIADGLIVNGVLWYAIQVGAVDPVWVPASAGVVLNSDIGPFPIQDPVVGQCTGTLAPRLEIGDAGRVTFREGSRLRLRTGAGIGAGIILNMAEGTSFTVLNGPVCMNGYNWWQIQLATGVIGWSAEASRSTYFLEPLS